MSLLTFCFPRYKFGNNNNTSWAGYCEHWMNHVLEWSMCWKRRAASPNMKQSGGVRGWGERKHSQWPPVGPPNTPPVCHDPSSSLSTHIFEWGWQKSVRSCSAKNTGLKSGHHHRILGYFIYEETGVWQGEGLVQGHTQPVVTESKLRLLITWQANKSRDELLGQGIEILFRKPADREDGGLVSQRTILPQLELRPLL